jgi:type I restriction enzyme M protein
VINGCEATGFIDKKTAVTLLATGNPNVADLTLDEGVFLRVAERVNKTLHLGGINKNDRARLMAALLLSLLEDPGPNVESDLPILIDDINARSKAVLRKQGKPEFYPYVEIQGPTNSENHLKYRAAVVATIQELQNLNIRSAMNSGTDVLGKFYEVFLKYGNGAKEIGIVLTPRHITRFAVEAVGVGPNDIVLDPACGTGGFLVAAFDHVRKLASAAQIDRFKQYSLFGIERESYVAALAIVNMIFRGDGKNNIVEANCFSKFLHRTTVAGHATAVYRSTQPSDGEAAVTRVLMNPPFALKESDEKEYWFVEKALSNMVDGGLLFSVVPISTVAGDGGSLAWRRDTLLAHNTLLAVVSFPEELFVPISKQALGLVVRKGIPHPTEQPVLWGRVTTDGFRVSKARRLPAPAGSPNQLRDINPILRNFLLDPAAPVANVPEFVKVSRVDRLDPLVELLPGAYLDSSAPTPAQLAERLDRQVRDDIASVVGLDLRLPPQGRQTVLDASRSAHAPGPPAPLPSRKYRPVAVGSLFTLYPGEFHAFSEMDPGDVPVVSCADTGNGVDDSTYSIESKYLNRDLTTIAFNGLPLTTKIHPYSFATKDDVAVAVPKIDLPPEALIFIQAALNSERWRFSYYRKCYMDKLIRFEIALPVTGPNHAPDVPFMVQAVQDQPYWWFLAPRFKDWKPTLAAEYADYKPKNASP